MEVCENPQKPAWRRLKVPKLHHPLRTSMPRILSGYARSDNARRRAVQLRGTFEGTSLVPVSSRRSNATEEPAKAEQTGALGRLRHLFESSAEDPRDPRPLSHRSNRTSVSRAAASTAAAPEPTLSQLRRKHRRLRFPRFAEKGAEEELGMDAEWLASISLHDWSGGSDDDEGFDPQSSYWTTGGSSSFYPNHNQERARRRKLQPLRPAMLRRPVVVPPVSVGSSATLNIGSVDDKDSRWDPHESSTSLSIPHGEGSSTTRAMTKLSARSLTSWAPSSVCPKGSVDRKWVTRVPPISCLPLEVSAGQARREMTKALEAPGGPEPTRLTKSALEMIAAAGAAGGYLNFQNWSITDDYIEALLEAHDGVAPETQTRFSLTDVPVGLQGVKHIQLAGNLLTERGLKALVYCHGPSETLQTLSLGSNRLGREASSTELLCAAITALPNLTELDLSGNALGDAAAGELCRVLPAGCPQLRGLGLARCRLGESAVASEGGAALGSFLVRANQLRILDLNWNALHGDGAEAFLDGLHQNASFGDEDQQGGVRRLSLAWNRLGSGRVPKGDSRKAEATRCAKLLAAIFQDCKTLFHLDLSYNGFDAEDCGILAAGLAKNQTLFGLHLVGNEATMDDLGFIIPMEGGRSPPAHCGDPTVSAMERTLHLSDKMHSVPMNLKLSHPAGISATAAKAKLSPRRMRCNPGLALDAPSGKSSVASLPRSEFTSSKEMFDLEHSWALEQGRVAAVGHSLDEDAEGIQYNAKCCWICENWCEYKVIFSRGKRKIEAAAVYALFSLDGFTRPTELHKIDQLWMGSRMLPPSLVPVEVIFVVDGVAQVSDAHAIRKLTAPKAVVLDPLVFGTLPVETSPEGVRSGGGPIILEAASVNSLNAGLSAIQKHRAGEPSALCILEDATDRSQVEVLPRALATEKTQEKIKEVKVRDTWTFETSSFRDYLRDFKCKPEECFDRDWSLAKVPRLFKDDKTRKELQKLLRWEYYPTIVAFWCGAMWDFQSLRSSVGLSFNAWRELIFRSPGAGELVADPSCGSKDVDIVWVACDVIDKDKRKTIKVLPDKALSRFQFMEAVLRLAFKRCLHGKVSDASPEELKKAVDDLEEMLHIGEEWMENRKSLHASLFVEECCMVYRDYAEPLKVVYDGFTSVSSYPGRRGRILSLGGWLAICARVSPEEQSERLFRQAFAIGREIRADETSTFRHMELSWPEYLVSLGGVVRLHPDFDPEFFADQLADFFEYFKTLSDDILAGNPVTAGKKLGNPKDEALMEFIKQIFEECDEDEGGTIDETEFEHCFMREEVQKQLQEFSIPVSNLKTMFKTLDKDGEGKLSFEELSDGFLKLAAIMRSNDRAIGYLNKIFAEADEDQSGTLNKEEFSNIFSESSVQRKMDQLGIHAADMEDLFGMIDEDGSGQVTVDEVIAAFIQLRDPNTAGERGAALLSKIFAEADSDKSGSLDKDEFVTAFSHDSVTQQLRSRNLKVPEWETLFGAMDEDGSGSLTWEELREGLVSYWARQAMEAPTK